MKAGHLRDPDEGEPDERDTEFRLDIRKERLEEFHSRPAEGETRFDFPEFAGDPLIDLRDVRSVHQAFLIGRKVGGKNRMVGRLFRQTRGHIDVAAK